MVLEAIATAAILSPNGTLQIGRQALREALYQTSNFEGVTGSLSCHPFGDCAHNPFSTVQFQDPRTSLQGLENNRVSDSLPHE